MPFLDKLLESRKSHRRNQRRTVPQHEDRSSALLLGAGQVRILLFRECEWRGRKLLFDSVTLEKQPCRNKPSSPSCNSKITMKRPSGDAIGCASGRDSEKERAAEDDVSLLSEMVFGTVAMTYRGSSFKIHSMDSPPCIMCSKIFPATEHNACRRSERVSDEGLGRSMVNFDSTSSVRTLLSRPSSGNLSGSDLSHGSPRKNSSCSSTGSGWDIDIPPPVSSSQSLESSGSSGIGSLTSLRRRWFRAVSTSFGRNDSDEAFGMQHWPESGSYTKEPGIRRHKTRLGLTMLVRLTEGDERKLESRLLEHMALVEGMLDRIRFSCIETINVNGQMNAKSMLLSERLYRSSSRFILSLLRLLMDTKTGACTPLLWHDVLLNSVNIEEKTHNLSSNLEQMCQLLDELDTKSTNFFMSTVVTAVLTYHLGWIYTALPASERQRMEKLGSWYPCNPMWAQLGDLHGALGNPVKLAHTVIAGDSRKSELINSVLSFLSYFIRSGLVKKRLEKRCHNKQDFEDATSALEQARLKRPYLFNQARRSTAKDRDSCRSRRDLRASSPKLSSQPLCFDRGEGTTGPTQRPSQFSLDPSGTDGSISALKRSSTLKSNLPSLALKPNELDVQSKLTDQNPGQGEGRYNFPNNDAKVWPRSKVKIIVSESRDPEETKPEPTDSGLSLASLSKKFDLECTEDAIADLKLGPERRQDDFEFDTLKVYTQPQELEFGRKIEQGRNDAQVMFMLGGEEKMTKVPSRQRLGYNCQCSHAFSTVPSTSAQLPEGVLRKIIQRNFPESSKSMQPPAGPGSPAAGRSMGFCEKCNGLGFFNSQNFDDKQVLETPTNATEVLRTCGSGVGDRAVRMSRSNSLEALMEASGVVELPMPRSKKFDANQPAKDTGFTRTLLQTKMAKDTGSPSSVLDNGYTWGLVLQGLTKKKKRRKEEAARDAGDRPKEVDTGGVEKDWWWCMREECFAGVRFPIIDQPVDESLCIVADLDTCHVGILSSTAPMHSAPLPVGMSRLISNMLEAFAYVWRTYHSPSHCIGILESKLREMWHRSEALAEMLLATEICDANVASLTRALDLEAADLPLLLAVATAHTPEIAERFGLTLT